MALIVTIHLLSNIKLCIIIVSCLREINISLVGTIIE